MKRNELGNTGVTLSEVILGCWQMGGNYFGGEDDKASVECIRAALECGITTFDTAYCYGEGHSEEVVGKTLEGVRDECTIITKLWKTFMGKDDVIPECERELSRLRTDRIDVYFIHYPHETIPIGETMEQLNKLRDQGKIRAVGLSNFSLKQMKEAMSYGKIDIIQPCYSLLWRYIDKDILPFCIENGIGVIPYSPLAQGMLTGRVKRDTVFTDGRAHVPLFLPQWRDGACDIADALLPIAEKYGRTQAQVALNWVLRTPGITAVIAGATNARHVPDNKGAADFAISDEDYRKLDEMSRKFTGQLPHYNTFFDGTIVEDDEPAE